MRFTDYLGNNSCCDRPFHGIGGVGVCSGLQTQKVAGSNPVVNNPARSALRSQLRWVYAISSGRLSRMIGKSWLRVKWGGSLLKTLSLVRVSFSWAGKTLVNTKKIYLGNNLYAKDFQFKQVVTFYHILNSQNLHFKVGKLWSTMNIIYFIYFDY